jgi:hypothetical protein
VGISAADDPNAFLQAYAEITVRVLAELGLVGAFLSALALIPAALGFRQASDERSGT